MERALTFSEGDHVVGLLAGLRRPQRVHRDDAEAVDGEWTEV